MLRLQHFAFKPQDLSFLGKNAVFRSLAPDGTVPPPRVLSFKDKTLLEQFHMENVDCSGRRESDYPQPNIRKNHAFSVV